MTPTVAEARAGAVALGLDLDDATLGRLVRFCELILAANRAFNLVSRRDTDRLLARHVLDSLSALPHLRGDRILDIGTGAGFPGVPLALACPDKHFVLCDRTGKRIRFVQRACRELQLDNVSALVADADSIDGPFTTIAARGVAAAEKLWSVAESRLAEGGCLLVYTSTRQPEAAVESQQRFRVHTIGVKVPGLDQPHEILKLERP